MRAENNSPVSSIKGNFLLKIIPIGLLMCLCLNPLNAQDKKTQLQNNKKKLEQEIALSNKMLDETRKSREMSVSQLNLLNIQIKKREELLSAINVEVVEIDREININKAEIKILEDNIRQLQDAFARMIYYSYKTRKSHDRLMFIFSSKDFNQAYQRLKYLQLYGLYMQKQAAQIEKGKSELVRANLRLQLIRDEKAQLLKKQEAEKQQLAKTSKEKSQAIEKLKKKEGDLRSTIKKKEKEAQELQAAIKKLIDAEIKASAKKAGTKPLPNAITLAPEEVTLSKDFGANKGKLPWPVEKGFISGYFGQHPHPVLPGIVIKNDGLNFTTAKGSNARAVFDGTVSAVTSIPGYNNVVLIRHGEYLSVYTNLESVLVKVGDKVKTRQNLGSIFYDTKEANTSMHFELRKGTLLLNPSEWLIK